MRRFGVVLTLALMGCEASGTPDARAFLSGAGVQPKEIEPRYIALLKAQAPALQIGFPDKAEGGGTLLLEDRDDAFEYWLSPEGAQVILQDGVLHGLRGFGAGLMASDLTEPLANLQALSPGVSDRFQTFLTGDDKTQTRTYRCVFEQAGTEKVDLQGATVEAFLMIERCRNLDQAFENYYWVEPSRRRIVLSRQWAGPGLGALSTRVVP